MLSQCVALYNIQYPSLLYSYIEPSVPNVKLKESARCKYKMRHV